MKRDSIFVYRPWSVEPAGVHCSLYVAAWQPIALVHDQTFWRNPADGLLHIAALVTVLVTDQPVDQPGIQLACTESEELHPRCTGTDRTQSVKTELPVHLS